MKKLLLAICIIGLTSAVSTAQTTGLKVGHVSVEYVLSLMPEMKSVESDLTAYEKQLQNQITAKQEELRTKLQAYERDAPNMIDAVRADKELEIQNMQRALQQFSVNAERSLQNKQSELLAPLYEKIEKAINDVADEQGYSHIFRSEALVYAKDTQGISTLVLNKLGITPPAETSNAE